MPLFHYGLFYLSGGGYLLGFGLCLWFQSEQQEVSSLNAQAGSFNAVHLFPWLQCHCLLRKHAPARTLFLHLAQTRQRHKCFNIRKLFTGSTAGERRTHPYPEDRGIDVGEGKLNQIPWLIVIFQEKNMFCLCVWLFFLRYAILLALDTVFHPVLCGERNQESRSKPFQSIVAAQTYLWLIGKLALCRCPPSKRSLYRCGRGNRDECQMKSFKCSTFHIFGSAPPVSSSVDLSVSSIKNMRAIFSPKLLSRNCPSEPMYSAVLRCFLSHFQMSE